MLYKNRIKPCLDVFFAIVLLMVLGPVLATIALGVRLTLGKPIVFRQARGGLNGTSFQLFKFRTMREAFDDHNQPLPDEQRLTSLGKVLRQFSLDELPSLINVIKGDMSLIGPRPFIASYLPLYNAYQQQRHLVKPGITGWAQVNGRNALSWEQKFDLDVWYVHHQSAGLDLKILGLTLFHVLKHNGINYDPTTTMPLFSQQADRD